MKRSYFSLLSNETGPTLAVVPEPSPSFVGELLSN
jgi:hypothetical protein